MAARCPSHGVIAIARAYGVDPVDGLIAAGWITAADLANGGHRSAARRTPTVVLAAELHRRAIAAQESDDVDQLRRTTRAWH